MDNIKFLAIAFVVVAGFFFWLGGKMQAPEIVENTVTETVVEYDTTKVDSLVSENIRLEELLAEERTQREIDEPDTVEDVTEDESRTITTTFSDSLIVANNYLRMNVLTGEIEETRFSYMLKSRFVRTIKRNINTTITRDATTTTTKTRTVKEGMFFQVGAFTNLESVFPAVSITTRDKTTVIYGYDPWNKTHQVGVMIRF